MRRAKAGSSAPSRSDARRPPRAGLGPGIRIQPGARSTRRVWRVSVARLITAGIAWITLFNLSAVSAQGIGGGPGFRADSYRSRPTLSPYLDLLRIDSGVLPPYHAFVVPRRKVEQQQARQGRAIGALRRQSAASERGSEPLPTGRGGQFQNTLHYYPQLNSGGRTRSFGGRR